MIQLHKAGVLNRVGKAIARPLSMAVCSRFFYTPSRAADAYLNFLLGKGSGTGWDLRDEVSAAAERIYRDRPVVFDVGANLGSWSRTFLKLFPNATVFMFEPSGGCQGAIRATAELSGATLIPCAVGERQGKATLYASSLTDGSASLHERMDSFFRDRRYVPVEVEVVTLDGFIEEQGLSFVDLVKMDIEGHEPFALRGARRALAAGRIGAMTFEFGTGNINSRTFFREIWDVLSPQFSIWRITPSGRPIAIEDYYEDLEYFRGVSNYVAELKDHPFAGRDRIAVRTAPIEVAS